MVSRPMHFSNEDENIHAIALDVQTIVIDNIFRGRGGNSPPFENERNSLASRDLIHRAAACRGVAACRGGDDHRMCVAQGLWEVNTAQKVLDHRPGLLGGPCEVAGLPRLH